MPALEDLSAHLSTPQAGQPIGQAQLMQPATSRSTPTTRPAKNHRNAEKDCQRGNDKAEYAISQDRRTDPLTPDPTE